MSDVGNDQTSGGAEPVATPGTSGTEATPPAADVPAGDVATTEEPAGGELPAAPARAAQSAEPAGEDVVAPEPPVVHKHFVAPALIPLDRVDVDDTFRIRPEEELADVSGLATDIARLGQLFPIDVRLRPPDRFQVVTGFRRVAALRFLQRERVLARLHTDLSDDDALLMALAAAIHGRSVEPAAIIAVRDRLAGLGQLSPAARDMVEKAVSTELALAPEHVDGEDGEEAADEEEDDETEGIDADEFAADLTVRLSGCNQDLGELMDVFDDLDEARREALVEQLRYAKDLVQFLESRRG